MVGTALPTELDHLCTGRAASCVGGAEAACAFAKVRCHLRPATTGGEQQSAGAWAEGGRLHRKTDAARDEREGRWQKQIWVGGWAVGVVNEGQDLAVDEEAEEAAVACGALALPGLAQTSWARAAEAVVQAAHGGYRV